MGKGDQKSKRGKINRGTSGVRRQKKKISTVAVVEKPKAAPKKKAATKKAVPKKSVASKTEAKKAPAKKPAAKKTTTKKKAED
jgi:30S ribosomal protein S31